MILRSSACNCLFSGNQFPARTLTCSRITKFHGPLNSKSNHDSAPLTLATLGFSDTRRISKDDRIAKPPRITSWSNTGSVKVRKQTISDNGSKNISSLEVQKSKLSRKAESNKFVRYVPSDRIPANEVKIRGESRLKPEGPSTSEVKLARESRSKPEVPRTKIDIDSSLFSAKSFSELGLSPLLLKRLDGVGLQVPTEVQSTAIPTISRGHDVVIQSYTGSGKTFAYLLPILSEVGPLKRFTSKVPDSKSGVEAVIVAPSRELGMQIVREIERLLIPQEKKIVQQLVGGANPSRQVEALKKNKPAIVVGTPGRIAEMSVAGKLLTHGCRFLVLDEVDQLLTFTYRADMHRILEHVGRRPGASQNNESSKPEKRAERQLVMVSATVPFSVIRAAGGWGMDPLLVKAKSAAPLEIVPMPKGPVLTALSASESTSASVTQAAVDSLPPALEHYYCTAKAQHKVDTLRRCVHALEAKSVMVFMNHSKQLKDVVFKLEARGMKAAALHGDLGKLGRSTTLKGFKSGAVRVLVTNELSARGLDVFDCDLVVNLDLPTDSVHYAHRAGRTGRLGQKGTVVTICEMAELFVVKKLSRQLGVAIKACEFNDGRITIRDEEGGKHISTEATE